MTKKLSPTQERALAKMTDKFLKSYQLGESDRTFKILADRGLVECSGEPGNYFAKYRKKQQ